MPFKLFSNVLETRVFLVIAVHWTMAITLVFVNKRLVSAHKGSQDLTVFIAWAQCLFSVLTIFVATAIKRRLYNQTSWLSISALTFLHSDVLAMAFTFIGVIVMNNLLLKHIGVAFYQVARSSTLIFTVVFGRLFLGSPVTCTMLVSCAFIIVGFAISVDQEMFLSSLSLVGVLYGILASMFAALSGIYIKRADRLVKGNSLEISLTTNVNGIVLLLPLVWSTGQLQYTIQSSRLTDYAMWWMLAVTGVLSLLVGWASNKVIGLTSPLTHNMSINAKSLLQTLIAVAIQGESKTLMWWLGNVLVMIGLVNYGLSKAPNREMEINVRKSSEVEVSYDSESEIFCESESGQQNLLPL